MGTKRRQGTSLDLRPCVLLGYCRKRPRTRSEAKNPPIDKLMDDLLLQILIRLPNPRSACRCKSVCKPWRSLISSPGFNINFLSHHQKMQLHHQPPMPLNPNELRSIILSFLPAMPNSLRDSLRVLDCFKDLVLCGWWDMDGSYEELGRSYFICNPFTKQWIALLLKPRKPRTGYAHAVAKLVCEPRVSYNHDLGDGQAFVYSEYRFRVVCMYKPRGELSQHIDVFCSESGKWIERARCLTNHTRIGSKSVRYCNGELFWKYEELVSGDICQRWVAELNPFRLDIPPTKITAPAFIPGGEHMWLLSSSQGALHAISFEREVEHHLRPIIWRLEEDRKSWRKLREGLVKDPTCCNCESEHWFEPFLHPHNPEIIFFLCPACENSLMSCDLRREDPEVELFAKLEEGNITNFLVQVFEPEVSYWPTPIPRYEDDSRGIYHGSYNWVQSEATIPQITQNAVCIS